MSQGTATRRPLRFDSLDDVVRDADWLTYPVEGFPKVPLPIRVMLRLVRATMGRGMLEKYLRDGMPTGKPTMPQSVHPAGGDPAAAVGRLRDAVRRFRDHPGDYLPSPLFGRLTRDEALRVQLAHAAHHLSFLVPRT